ncbi:hypothetical protein A2926_03645 [Candidatus Giovannonibacteria bacterium RIFCSPLOWO2_01_FULL_44_40]|uniref:Peptide deformylase n=1 Tax=Candidatus Giovannonibacteria bacterium RIFCSPHIGHO2_01_FULL_45_23 TaxID=1798325 RepID=A0A1F5VJ69_9BACT|nr:MAG: hypothetical protein A2834_04060 [Candidatus Giovannonibacteria bacterium RIFCSPHIGHO2_01_FULL_45_23]OGF75781.1 MAG: hypothetical protein A3C77_04305 [Candidatus Giovannonibacteria bacterium RIFCSPHIGHO2_02_FULL_45_13]OGF79633.1 MAG: hypothetical protein A2926_03645 [Candidatus Giovannonibacteria bacterium RIFCSPLOWO2_01_FULL_44_40]
MILQKENKILRGKAEIVANPKSADIKSLIEWMADAMFAEPDGVGIAAPQIGVGLRVFLVAKDFLRGGTPGVSAKGGSASGGEERKKNGRLVFINPILKKCSQKKENDIEGCLSVRGVYGEVKRCEKVTVEYFDESGKKHARGASGLLARVIQHELDHLNGVLFIDKAKNIKKLT